MKKEWRTEEAGWQKGKTRDGKSSIMKRALQREITFLQFHFFRLFEITATYMSNLIPLTQLLILESTCLAH